MKRKQTGENKAADNGEKKSTEAFLRKCRKFCDDMDRKRVKEFAEALKRAKDNDGDVIVVELSRTDAAALALCAVDRTQGNKSEFVLSWLRSGLECDLEGIEAKIRERREKARAGKEGAKCS